MAVSPGSFFGRATVEVARDLLGAVLHASGPDGQWTAGRIVETEAYGGQDDPASHAAGGRTPRSEIMFGPPGVAYVYLIYGMHHCLNFVTEAEDVAGAVLIRALEPVSGEMTMAERRGLAPCGFRPRDLCTGPGKLCQALGIDRAWNHVPVTFAAGEEPARALVLELSGRRVSWGASPRIGITRAREWPHRFFLSGSGHLSR